MKTILVVLLLHIPIMSFSQDLKKHQWKNRILLIISQESCTDAAFPELMVKQHNMIKDSLQGYADRKLVVYKIFPLKYKFMRPEVRKESKWLENSSLYKIYNPENKPFKIVLIGLDGGIKEERDTWINSLELFTIIDGMSMRKAEMRNKK
ncbi:MAG: DUF4174 domain-containing protein [Nonlabens sp.]|uniref:DUF4174 domain-containing protein n=1 Tax=Nonlabens sp. TaxID=1888209 RepID=UPI00321B673E